MKKLLLLMFMAGSLSPALLNAMEPTEETATNLIEAQNDFWLLAQDVMQGKEIAVKDRLYKIIPILVQYKQPIQDHYFNPLFYAVWARDPELVRFLIQ